jgi:hypothetical protein
MSVQEVELMMKQVDELGSEIRMLEVLNREY